MRIIEPPVTAMGTNGRMTTHIKCSDGKTYLVTELAEQRGLTRNGLLQRIRKKGWDHPNILDKKVESGFRLDGKISDGNEEWQRLTRDEVETLHIPGPGLLEQRYL